MKLPNKLRTKTEIPPPVPLQQEVRRAAERFMAWANERLADRELGFTPGDVVAAENLVVRECTKAPSVAAMPERFASDFAAYLGETVRHEWRGDWADDALLGLVLRDVDGMPGLRLVPLAMAEKKWELRENLSLAQFIENLPARLDQERRWLTYQVGNRPSSEEIARDLAETSAGRELAKAQEYVRNFGDWWKTRFGFPLPLTLQGVRELERFIRSQFFLFSLHEETLAQFGFFIGEVGRGLFEGEWNFDELREGGHPSRVALAWPELSYYPIGRIYKMFTERQESDALDEYLRLIPSARHELRTWEK